MNEQALMDVAVKEPLRIRAQRFAIQLALRYRIHGQGAWRRGETINLSSSGVLFRGEHFADPETPIEMNLMMPAVNSTGAAEVVCRGTIARATPSSSANGHPALAVRILHYRVVCP
jgi:hypothetical protein